MLGYIYKTTNKINGKIYVGQHIASCFEPDNYIGSGVLLKKAIAKYGINSFNCELLATADTQVQLNALEIYFIDKLDSKNPNIGYNLCDGGCGGNLGYKFTEIQKLKLSKSHKGHKQSQEAIQKQSDKLRGRIVITNGTETKLIYPKDFSYYQALGWFRGRPTYSRSKPVICFETGEVFSSLNEVLNKYPSAGALKRCVKSSYSSTCCGLHWYLQEDTARKDWLQKNIKYKKHPELSKETIDNTIINGGDLEW